MRITKRWIAGCVFASFSLAFGGLWLSWTGFDPLAPVVERGIDESERSRLARRTGLWLPPASRFQLSRTVGGLQGGDTDYKLRLTNEYLRRFIDQPGLVRLDSSLGNDRMMDDAALPEWRPNSVRRPVWRQSTGDGWREPKVIVLAESAPGESRAVYVSVSDPLE